MFSSFNWDDPHQVLLTLAAVVESNMGGSSGAVGRLTVLIMHGKLFLSRFITCS